MNVASRERPKFLRLAAVAVVLMVLMQCFMAQTPATAAPHPTFTQAGITYEVLTPADGEVGQVRITGSEYGQVASNLDLSGEVVHTWPANAPGESGSVLPADDVQRYKVTEIWEWAFYSRNLTSVALPSGLTQLGMYAFYDNRLTSVVLPDSLSSIPLAAFGWNQIREVQWPSSGLTAIGESAFSSNQMSEILVPQGVTSIEGSAFANNPATYIRIPASVTNIGQWSFSSTPNPCSFTAAVVVFEGNAPSLTSAATNRDPGDPCRAGESFFSGYGSTAGDALYFSASATGFEPLSEGKWQGYAAHAQQTQTVEFESSGGSAASAVTVMTADRLASLPTVTRAGHTFTGWYLDSALTQEFSLNSPVLSDLTLYAGWQQNFVEVSFAVNGGEAISPLSTPEGQPLADVPTPVREWYAFTGWYTDPELTESFDPGQAITENLTLYADWERELVTITFDVNGGESIDAVTAPAGEPLANVPTPVRDGHTFTGWFTNASFATPVDFALSLTQSATVYAGWLAVPAPVGPGGSPAAPASGLAQTGQGGNLAGWGMAGAALTLLGGALLLARGHRSRVQG